jgi:aminopeptidase N
VFEALWLEHSYDADMFRFEILDQARIYIAECESYTRPIVDQKFDSPWERYDMHAYPGGALRIHMLRHKLGDTVFWGAVKDYVNTFKGCNVETSDFQKCLEKASGINLVKFFDQWYPAHFGLSF